MLIVFLLVVDYNYSPDFIMDYFLSFVLLIVETQDTVNSIWYDKYYKRSNLFLVLKLLTFSYDAIDEISNICKYDRLSTCYSLKKYHWNIDNQLIYGV